MNIGTKLFTFFHGKLIGADGYGNRYFIDRRPGHGHLRVRRWVIYPGSADPSSVPAEWHAWLHYTTDAPLADTPHYAWQKPHLSNATGTAAAYRPPGHDYLGGHRPVADGDYESWVPEDATKSARVPETGATEAQRAAIAPLHGSVTQRPM